MNRPAPVLSLPLVLLLSLPLFLPGPSPAAGTQADPALTDIQLARLLTATCWGSFSTRSAWSRTGPSPAGQPTTRFSFRQDGTFSAVTASAPAEGGGRWQLRSGRLLVSWGEGPFEEQRFRVKCTQESVHMARGLASFLLAPGGDFAVDGEGTIRCACDLGGYPVLEINGCECCMRECD